MRYENRDWGRDSRDESTGWAGLEGDGGIGEVFSEQTLGEGFEVFASFGEGEGVGGVGPLELEAGGDGGDPDLADGGVGGNDKLGGAVLEDDIHDAVVVFELEGAGGVLGGDESLLEGFEGVVGVAAEGGFVKHTVSLARAVAKF